MNLIDIQAFSEFERLSGQAADAFDVFLLMPKPRSIPHLWRNALQPELMHLGKKLILAGLVGSVVCSMAPPLGFLAPLFFFALITGLIFFAAGYLFYRFCRNILMHGELYKGKIAAMLRCPLGYCLKITLPDGTIGYTAISCATGDFYRIDELKQGAPVHLIHKTGSRLVLLPLALYYRERSGKLPH